ncbi:MAG: hypothetical protein ACUVTX_05235 [Bacteroidales bacterium]
MSPTRMVINHEGINLTVERTSQGPDGEFTATEKFTLDGKECTNPFFGNNTRKSVVKWAADSKSLVFNHTMTFERDGETRQFNTTETWKYNEADKTLSTESVFNTPNGEMKMLTVYDKK